MRFNPEHAFERRDRLTEPEERLYRTLVEQASDRIELDEFADLYGEETIQKDTHAVETREAKFKEERGDDPSLELWQKRGMLFEAMVKDQIEESDWMGAGAEVITPSRYDDIMNGVDGIIEFREGTGQSHLALAIDVTESSAYMEKKFRAIEQSIASGNLSRVKYFRSSDGGFRGELQQVPRVVVGADHASMQELAELLDLFKTRQTVLKKEKDAGTLKRFKESQGKLAEHPIQFKVLLEIKTQLEASIPYAIKCNKEKAADAYQKVLSIINQIFKEKSEGKNIRTLKEELEVDSVFKMISDRAASIGKV